MNKELYNKQMNKKINNILIKSSEISNKLNNNFQEYNNVLPKRYKVTSNIKSYNLNPQKINIKKSQKILEQINNKMNLLSTEELNYLEKNGNNLFLKNNLLEKKNNIKKSHSLNKFNLKSVLFKEIFVKPKEDYLEKVKQTTEKFIYNELNPQDKIIKEYQEKELKKFKNEEEEKPDELVEMIKEINKKTDYYEVYNKSLLKKISNKNLKENNSFLLEIKKLNKSKVICNSISNINRNYDDEDENKNFSNEKLIFDQQIQVESPDIYNIKNNNFINPGIGYAPSIPIFLGNLPKLYDLLIRVNSGLKEGEIQKEAHIYFYLGITLENKKKYNKSNFYYKKYFKCAKNLEDKIGMSFSLNRIAVNYGKLKNIDKSLEYNLKNKKISDFENTFAALYNIGICYRLLKDIQTSNKYFEEALDWSKKKKDLDTKCLVYGQLGLNYEKVRNIEKSIRYFDKCKTWSSKIGNHKLNLDALICLSKLKGKNSRKLNQSKKYFSEALNFANNLKDQNNFNLCKINLGILNGNEKFKKFQNGFEINLKVDQKIKESQNEINNNIKNQE